MRLRFETIFLVWFQAQSCMLYDVEGCSTRFFEVPSRFFVYGTHHHLQVFSIWYRVKTISWRIVRKADIACTMILPTYRPLPCPNTFSDLLSLSFRHGLSYWGAKVVLEVIVIWGRYRFKVNVRHQFRTPTSYIGLRKIEPDSGPSNTPYYLSNGTKTENFQC